MNVKVITPLCPAGLKLFPVTLVPLQVPLKPPCVVPSDTAGSKEQTVGNAGILIVLAKVTFTVVVLDKRHCPGFGLNVSVIAPVKPLGLKVLPLTPVPLHVPVMPPCVVLSVTGESIEHKLGMEVKVTAVGAFTVTVVVLLLAH